MNYLVAVLSNRNKAEEAYSAIKSEKLTSVEVDILGNGYKSNFPLTNADKVARTRALRLLYSLIPGGFVCGLFFNWLTGIQILPLSGFANELLGGLLGAIVGALGLAFVGTSVGLTQGSDNALFYRDRLNLGKYLVTVKGVDEPVQQASKVLCQFEPESIQGYAQN